MQLHWNGIDLFHLNINSVCAITLKWNRFVLLKHQLSVCNYTEMESLSFWWNFLHWLHWKLSSPFKIYSKRNPCQGEIWDPLYYQEFQADAILVKMTFPFDCMLLLQPGAENFWVRTETFWGFIFSSQFMIYETYRKTSNISLTLVGNKIVDNSDVVGASPVGAAPTTSSLST